MLPLDRGFNAPTETHVYASAKRRKFAGTTRGHQQITSSTIFLSSRWYPPDKISSSLHLKPSYSLYLTDL
ncbi:MAG: hypothetical protein AB8G77_26240 [Rhodothermales bacterium]